MSIRILLVSRDVVTLFGIGAILRSRYEVDFAFTSAEAFQKLMHDEYAAVLTSTSLEEEGAGLTVAEAARRLSDTPTAFITNSGGNQWPPNDEDAESVTLRLLSKRDLLRRVDELIREKGATFPPADKKLTLIWKRDD